MTKRKNAEPPAIAVKVVTDGIRVRTQYTLLDGTGAAMKQFAKVWGNDDIPKDWIEALEEKLGRLENVTPAIQLHVDAIRAIHAQIPSTSGREQTWLLTQAQQHWTDIMLLRNVMPKARQAKKREKQLTEFAAKGNKARKKYSDADKARWRALAESDASLIRLRKTSARKCAEAIANREGLPEGAAETIRRAI